MNELNLLMNELNLGNKELNLGNKESILGMEELYPAANFLIRKGYFLYTNAQEGVIGIPISLFLVSKMKFFVKKTHSPSEIMK